MVCEWTSARWGSKAVNLRVLHPQEERLGRKMPRPRCRMEDRPIREATLEATIKSTFKFFGVRASLIALMLHDMGLIIDSIADTRFFLCREGRSYHFAQVFDFTSRSLASYH